MSANSPEEVHELFTRHFSDGNLEELLSLYEPNATLAPLGGPPVSGRENLRAALSDFLAPKPILELTVKKTIRAGELALVMSTWVLKGTDPETGKPIERAGQTSDVVRQQPDGSWLLVIDVPHGAAVARE